MVASPPVSVESVAADLERLEPAAVASAVEVLAAEGVPLEEILDGTLLPAWERLEARNRSGDAGAAVASAAAALARRSIIGLSRLARRVPAGTAGSLTVVSPGAAVDQLCSEAVSEVAGAAGWVVQQVDGDDAAGELSAYIRCRRPAAVVVTAHDPADLLALLPVVGVAHAEGISVLAWGAAFGEGGRRARRMGADGWVPDLRGVLATVTSWQEQAPAISSPIPLPAAYGELERLRPVIVQAALGAGDALWARRAAPALLDQLGAAVVFEDPGILAEHLGREQRGQVDDARIVGLVDAIAAALPLTAGVARDYVVAARDELRRSLLGPGAARPDDGHVGAGGLGGAQAGQVFADLLLLAALSCQTQLALLSVPQGAGRWRTLSYGFEVRDGLDDPRLFELIASRREAIEVADMSIHPALVRSPLTLPPHALRWAYGMTLSTSEGQVLGVVAVLDRWLRQVTRREHRALSAVARQASEHLVQLRRGVPPLSKVVRPGNSRDDPLSSLVSLRRSGSMPDGQQLMRSHEVAVLFDVTERTVINWAASGKLPSLRTIGGHLRFRREDVLTLLDGRGAGLGARRSS